MLIAALLGSVGIPLDRDWLFVDLLLVDCIEVHMVGAQAHYFLILYKINFSGIFQYRRDIRRNKAPILILPHDQRTVLSDCKDLIRVVCKQDPKRIGSLDTVHDLRDGFEWISLVIIVDQMCQYFCICIGDKLVTL